MPFELGVDRVVEWLNAKDVIVPNDWVSACLDWLSSENQGNIAKEKIYQMVYEQWLYTSLRELEIETLPNSVKNDVSSLIGSYCLQVERILDISRPQNQVNEEEKYASSLHTQNKWEKKAARLLMLSLCDGTNTVDAIELKTIASLNENIRLGSKVRIRGPVKCRRGVILLEPHNIDFLGGEVEDLNEPDIHSNQQPSDSAQSSEPNEIVSSHQSVNERSSRTSPTSSSISLNNGSNAESNSVLRRNMQANSSSQISPALSQPETAIISLISDDEDDEILACLEEVEQTSSSLTNQDTRNVDDNSPIDVEMCRSGNDDRNVSDSCKINSTPLQYLCHCQRYVNGNLSVIRVKAVVTTLLSKLRYDSVTGWMLRASICDGTAILEVDFSNDVLLSLINHSGDRDLLSSENVELKRKLKNCQNIIMSVCHYMNVSLRSSESHIMGTISDIEGLS